MMQGDDLKMIQRNGEKIEVKCRELFCLPSQDGILNNSQNIAFKIIQIK